MHEYIFHGTSQSKNITTIQHLCVDKLNTNSAGVFMLLWIYNNFPVLVDLNCNFSYIFFLNSSLYTLECFHLLCKIPDLQVTFTPSSHFLLSICMFYPPWQRTHSEERIDTLILLGKISLLNFSPNQACVVFVDLLHQTNQSIVVQSKTSFSWQAAGQSLMTKPLKYSIWSPWPKSCLNSHVSSKGCYNIFLIVVLLQIIWKILNV